LRRRPRPKLGCGAKEGRMKLVRISKMCMNKTYTEVHVDRNLADAVPVGNGLKQENALSPLPFSFILGYTTKEEWK
jgi:hypothetical protein